MNDLLTIFLKDTYSLPQARRRLNVLRNFLDEKFFNPPSAMISEEDSAWIKSLPEGFLKNFTKLNSQKQVEGLRAQLNKLEPLIIYLPVEAPDQEIDKIGVWLRKNTSQVIFDTKLNPSLMGGAAISIKGALKDYSLKPKIEAQKEKILSTMKGFLR